MNSTSPFFSQKKEITSSENSNYDVSHTFSTIMEGEKIPFFNIRSSVGFPTSRNNTSHNTFTSIHNKPSFNTHKPLYNNVHTRNTWSHNTWSHKPSFYQSKIYNKTDSPMKIYNKTDSSITLDNTPYYAFSSGKGTSEAPHYDTKTPYSFKNTTEVSSEIIAVSEDIEENTKNNPFCNNCGKQGHMFHQCKMPITSYGMIVFRHRKIDGKREYLMIRRKDSFGYIDFIRGKYFPYHLDQIQNSINEMSVSEKEKLLEKDFNELWFAMWGGSIQQTHSFSNEASLSMKKFNNLKMFGITTPSSQSSTSGQVVKLKDIIERSPTKWSETEWEFPKGRRNFLEKDMDCALREFQEETGYLRFSILIYENVMAFEEIFIGSNHKCYKNKYFLGKLNTPEEDDINISFSFQQSEVSKIEWKTLDECLSAIRPYNIEKKKIIQYVDFLLENYPSIQTSTL
jgi:8-oxo-dGTP pyrophosphatase MutT (NUDIX family)